MSRLYLSDPCALLLPSHTALRAQSAPGFPCALLKERGTTNDANPGRKPVAGTSAVVPAKAGTHTPRRMLFDTMVVGFPSKTQPCGYGSRPSPGRLRSNDCDWTGLRPCRHIAGRAGRAQRFGEAREFAEQRARLARVD